MSDENKLSYKGVVLNEMFGAYSSPERILSKNIFANLFPDTHYKFESGGDPDVIPTLTYSQFLDAHKKYYHPSNSVIYLYGNCDIDRYMEFIDVEYLNKFSTIGISDIKIKEQPALQDIIYSSITFNSSSQLKNNNYLSVSFVIDKAINNQLVLAFSILNYMLLGTNTSPLKSFLLENGVGKDIISHFENNIYQPVFTITAKNSAHKNTDKFKELIFNKLNELVENKIEHKLIEAAINKREFIIREKDFGRMPCGLVYGIYTTQSIFYNDYSFDTLQQLSLLENIKSCCANSNYFEDIIKKYLLNNKHMSCITMLSQESESKRKAPVVNESELEKLKQRNKNFEDFQNAPDTLDILNQIPIISIDSITKQPEYISTEKISEDDTTIISSTFDTNDIIYLKLLFDTSAVPNDLLPYLGLLANILGNTNTKNYSAKQLQQLINKNMGNLHFYSEAFLELDSNGYHQKFIVDSKFMTRNITESIKLINEILINTKFDDVSIIKKIISQTCSQLKNRYISQGHLTSIARCLSFFCEGSKYNDVVSGIDFYNFIYSLEESIDESIDLIVSNLTKVFSYVSNKNNLIIGTASSDNTFLHANLEVLTNNMYSTNNKPLTRSFTREFTKEGLILPVKVQYNALASNFIKKGFSYSGKLLVLERIIDLGYMWNNIRVKNGAYGCGSSFKNNGNMYFFSYRDPNLIETYDKYNQLSEYIQNININQRELHKYIIGAINRLDKPKSNEQKNSVAIKHSITGVTYEDLKREREEVLSVSLSDIKNFYGLLNECSVNENICTIGTKQKIEANKNLFDKINIII